MRTRLQFHNFLKDQLSGYTLYAQPPSNYNMKYPCILYKLSRNAIEYGSNVSHIERCRYEVSLITKDIDDPAIKILRNIQYASLDTTFVTDGLHHFVYTIYY